MWLDFENKPVPWNLPFGMFLDIENIQEFPVKLTLNYRY